MNGYLLRWFGVFISLSSLASATELTRAIRLEDAPAVEAAIKSGKDINTLDGEALSPLFYAVVAGRPDWVKSLLARGAKPDVEQQRFMPLTAAATNGDAVSAKLLLAAGAKVLPDLRNRKGVRHPVIAAIGSGSVEVLQMLLENEPHLDLDKLFSDSEEGEWAGVSGWPATVVMDAVVNRNAEMALFLIKRGCRTTYQSEFGNIQDETPVLVAAVESGASFDPVVDHLIRLGQPPVRQRFAIATSMNEVPPWDALTAAVRQGNLIRAAQFSDAKYLPERMDLTLAYPLHLLRFAQCSGNPAMMNFIKKRLGGAKRLKQRLPDGYAEPPSENVDVTRILLPRRAKVPALKEPKAPVTVAVISSPGAENAGESLSALLPSLPGWKVVERSAVEALLREKEYQAPWGDGTKDLTGIGDRLAADTLLLVTRVGDTKPALLRIEVVDVRTGLALRRVHVSMEKFKPQEFTKDIASEVVAARERFAASGGQITAVSVLDIASRIGSSTEGGLASLVVLGLKEEIDNTPGAVAITRNQMQPLMEEKVVAGSESLWGAAWSLEGSVQTVTGERVRLTLRATNLQDGKKVDEAVEGLPSDPRALVREAWEKVRGAAGILRTTATSDPEASKREAAGLIAEAEWLMLCSRPGEAARVADAAFYLGADLQKVIPLRIKTHCHALPDASWVGKKTFLYPEATGPLMGLRMLGKMPEFMELAEIVKLSLVKHPEVMKDDVGVDPGNRYAFKSVWNALSRLVTYRLSLPEIELTPEEVQSLREFDQVLDAVEARLFAMLPGTTNELMALDWQSGWLREVDLSRVPRFREQLLDWIVGLLERGDPKAANAGMLISRFVSLDDYYHRAGNAQPFLHTAERMELANGLLSRFGKSSHSYASFWSARLKVVMARGSEKPKVIRELLTLATRMAEDGKIPPPDFLHDYELRAWIVSAISSREAAVPSSGDSILPELVHHPRPCGEFFRRPNDYFHWMQCRNDLAKGSRSWLNSFIDNFPKAANRRVPDQSGNVSSRKELLSLSYRESSDSKGILDLVNKVVNLPMHEAQALQKIAASQPDLASDVRNFGAHGLVPEIRFRNEIQPAKRLALAPQDRGSRFIATPGSMAEDKSSKVVWIGGATGHPDDYEFRATESMHVAKPTFKSLLIRYDLESETMMEFRPPLAAEPNWLGTSQIAVAIGYCVLADLSAVFAAPAKGEKSIGWGKDFRPVVFSGSTAVFGDSVYAIVEAVGNVGSEDRVIRKLYRLTPGLSPVLLADAGRRPEQSPLDNPRYAFNRVVVQNERIVLFANLQTASGTTAGGRAYATYDPKDGSWKAGAEGAEAEKKWRRDYEEQWWSEQGSFRASNGPRFAFKLSDGSEFSMPHIHVPGQLVFLSKGSGAKEEDFFVPIALSIPNDFDQRFQVRISGNDSSPNAVTDETLTAAECLRSAFVRPVTVAQTETHVMIAVKFRDYVPFPYLWFISKADIERSLKEQMEKRK